MPTKTCELCGKDHITPQCNECAVSECLYCDSTIIAEDDKHFTSACCERGMCEACYQNGQGTDEQLQLDYFDDVNNIIKPEYQNATYLCFNCDDIWSIKK